MHIGIPTLGWEKEIHYPERTSLQFVRNPANHQESGVRLMFVTDDDIAGRLILTAREAEQYAKSILDLLADNKALG